jgi:CrcB protein
LLGGSPRKKAHATSKELHTVSVNLLAVAGGAATGAVCRYLLGAWLAARLGTGFPYGTLLINLLGCLLIGLILTLAAERLALSEPLRLLLVTGLLGGFTTFSAFGYETYSLALRGQWPAATLYIAASVLGGLLCVLLGAWLARLAS